MTASSVLAETKSNLKNGIKLAQPLLTLFGAGELSALVQRLLCALSSTQRR
jgi:hypothetical protein